MAASWPARDGEPGIHARLNAHWKQLRGWVPPINLHLSTKKGGFRLIVDYLKDRESMLVTDSRRITKLIFDYDCCNRS